MADFSPAFAQSGERRFPTSDEQSEGFGCGAADMALFHGMFHRIEAELGAVIASAGIPQSNGDLTQVLQAIQALIEAATGGGETSSYLTILQARARLPIYPEVLSVSGHFGVTSPSTGQVRVPAGVNFQHRGIFPATSVQTDFATDPSKTYHLRWNPTDGFSLKDLASSTYNPSTLAEDNIAFDSKFDDMLVARVTTNSSNVPTVTNLINRDRYQLTGSIGIDSTERALQLSTSVPVNLGRKPNAAMAYRNDIRLNPTGGGEEVDTGVEAASRYNLSAWYRRSVLFGGSSDNGTIGWSAWL